MDEAGLGHFDGEAAGRHLGAGHRTAHAVDERTVVELHPRHVDVHPEAVTDEHVVLPCRQTVGRLVEHPVVDLLDEAALLGERDDPVGPEQAPRRVAPSQQRLETGQLPVGEVEDRLVTQLELAPVDRPHEVVAGLRALVLLGHRGHIWILTDRARPPQGRPDPFA